MVTFTCKITDPEGLTPKNAGLLVEKAVKCDGDVRVRNDEKTGNAKLIFNVLCLSGKCGDELEISIEGRNEAEDAKMLKEYLETIL